MTQPTPNLLECFISDIAALVDSFSEKDAAGKLALQQLLSSDPGTFRAAAMLCLRNASATAGYRYFAHLLMKERLLAPVIVDPALCSSEDAIAAAVAVRKLGVPLEDELVRVLGATIQRGGENALPLIRLLDILKGLGAEREIQLFQGRTDAAFRLASPFESRIYDCAGKQERGMGCARSFWRATPASKRTPLRDYGISEYGSTVRSFESPRYPPTTGSPAMASSACIGPAIWRASRRFMPWRSGPTRHYRHLRRCLDRQLCLGLWRRRDRRSRRDQKQELRVLGHRAWSGSGRKSGRAVQADR